MTIILSCGCYFYAMTDYTEDEITRLHVKLAAIYNLGPLTRQEQTAVQGLWARIERLETSRVNQAAKESKYREYIQNQKENNNG